MEQGERMAFEFRKISINSLELDQKNPRFPPTKDQKEALERMFFYLEDEIRRIAEDIVENGQNPTTIPAVLATPMGRFIVKDGNRRITAIKSLMYPSLIPKQHDVLKKKFEKMGKMINRTDFKYIYCVVFDNEKEVDHWIANNHQGKQDGVGLVSWGPIQKMRDRSNKGEMIPALEIFEFMQQNDNLAIDERQFEGMSTLERLVGNNMFLDYLGVGTIGGKFVRYRPEDEVIRLLEPVIDDIKAERINTRILNTAKSMENYVLEKRSESNPAPYGKEESEVLFKGPDIQSTIPPDVTLPRKRSGPHQTSVLIDKDLLLNISKTRIQDLFNDLKKLNINKQTNSVSVIFRTFMELSVKYYFDAHKMKLEGSFAEKMVKVSDDLHRKGQISTDVRDSINLLCSRKEDKSISIATELNQYGHNCEFNPAPIDLKKAWESLQEYVMAIWSSVKD